MTAFRRSVLFFALFTFLAGCSLQDKARRDRLDDQIQSYSKVVRWREMESALVVVNEPLREEYLKQCEKIRNSVQIVDYRILSTTLTGDHESADAVVEFDYYILPSTRVKTVVDNQKWKLFKDDIKSYWKLMSLPPEFK